MRKWTLIIALVFLGLRSEAQTVKEDVKQLDLRTAVMGRYGALRPNDLTDFRWLNQKDRFSYRGESGELVICNTDGDTVKVWTAEEISERNPGLGVLASLRIFDYSGGLFYFKNDQNLYSLNGESGVATKVLSFPVEAENLEFHAASGHLAYTVGPNVFVANSDMPKIPVTTYDERGRVSGGAAIARNEFGINKGLFWTDDGRKLGFYEMDESLVTDYPLANYETYPGTETPLRYPMAGQDSQKARVGIFNVADRSTIYLDTPGPRDQYLTNFTFSPDGNSAYVAVLNRDQNHMKLNAYDSKTGQMLLTLIEEKNDIYVEPEHPPIFADGNDGRFLWYSERDGYDQLYLYSTDGKLLRKITDGEYDVLDIWGFANDGRTVIVSITEGLMGEAVMTIDLDKGKTRKITKEEGSYSGAVQPGGDLVMIRQRSMTVPNVVMITNLKGKVQNTLLNAENPLEDYAVGNILLPVLEAEDGTHLQARLIKPYDFDPTMKYPVLVYVYGGPHAQMITQGLTAGAPLWMFHMANRGYLVFTVDGRGSANRGLKFEQVTFRNLGAVEMRDQLTGVDYLGSLPYADTSTMAIHGWSYGGYMTISMMLREPGVFDVGVAGGPVTNWALYEVMYTERYMDTPQTNPEGYAQTDLRKYVDNLQGDLLIIHGLDDNVVVPQHSYNILKAFVDAGKQVDFFVYPGHEHNVRGKDRVHLMEKVLDYIDLHLKKYE